MTRAAVRRRFAKGSTRGRRTMDFFCPSHGGIRVGYGSSALARALHLHGAAARRSLGRAVLVLTANHHYTLRGVRIGARVAKIRHRLALGRPFSVGRNTWYLVSLRGGRGVLKVRRGVVQEIGVATVALTRGRPAQRRFLRGFD